MSEFEFYLRTGRRIGFEWGKLETKFNPWHDPENGRFTFAGQGRNFGGRARNEPRATVTGFRGGGGSFGGGGASGSWPDNARQPFSGRGGSGGGGGATGSWPAPPAQRAAPVRESRPAAPTSQSSRRSAPARQDPRLTVRKNGYDYALDAHVRARRVSGEIRLQEQPRSRRAQSDAGRPDRRDTDDGGHFIAARFNGPREWFNHFAQDASFNRGVYRVIEDEWAKAVRGGQRVFVDIVPHYRGTSMRPHMLTVTWVIGGDKFKRDLPNERKGQ